MRNKLIFIGALLALLFCLKSWSEDEVLLKTGAVLKGKVVKDDENRIIIELAGGKGTITLKRDEVDSISLEEPELFARATASYKKGDYEKALSLYQEVTRQYASYDWGEKALFWIGESNLKMERWGDALAAYQQLLEVHPRTVFGHRAKLGMARVFYEQKEYEKAIETYQALVGQDGEIVAAALYGLGNCYFEKGKSEESLISYLKVDVLYYDFEDWVKKCIFPSGECYEKLGDLNRAKDKYQEVMEKYAGSEDAKKAEERLREIEVEKGG